MTGRLSPARFYTNVMNRARDTTLTRSSSTGNTNCTVHCHASIFGHYFAECLVCSEMLYLYMLLFPLCSLKRKYQRYYAWFRWTPRITLVQAFSAHHLLRRVANSHLGAFYIFQGVPLFSMVTFEFMNKNILGL